MPEEHEDQEYQAVLIGGPSNGSHMAVTWPVMDITIPTITKQGRTDEDYHLIGQTPKGRFLYEHQGAI